MWKAAVSQNWKPGTIFGERLGNLYSKFNRIRVDTKNTRGQVVSFNFLTAVGGNYFIVETTARQRYENS
jgi:hypothetical protein